MGYTQWESLVSLEINQILYSIYQATDGAPRLAQLYAGGPPVAPK